MNNLSKHLSIYSSQKESIFSILGRLTINGFALSVPLFYLFFSEIFLPFLLKWVLIVILFYHFFHFASKTLDSLNGILGVVLLTLFLTPVFWFFVLFHSLFGLRSFFKDYLVSKSETISFNSCYSFLHLLIFFFGFTLLGFIFFI